MSSSSRRSDCAAGGDMPSASSEPDSWSQKRQRDAPTSFYLPTLEPCSCSFGGEPPPIHTFCEAGSSYGDGSRGWP